MFYLKKVLKSTQTPFLDIWCVTFHRSKSIVDICGSIIATTDIPKSLLETLD
jgi:hypothetical protein